AWNRAACRAGRGLGSRAQRLLRRALSRAVPHPRARGRRACDSARALHDPDRPRSLARAVASARDREPVLRRRRRAGRRDDRRQARVRALADRRSLGIVLAQAPDEETVIVAELDRSRLLEIRAKLPSLANRQADAYRWPSRA